MKTRNKKMGPEKNPPPQEPRQTQSDPQAAQSAVTQTPPYSPAIDSIEIGNVNLRGKNEPLRFTMKLINEVPLGMESALNSLKEVNGIKLAEKNNSSAVYFPDLIFTLAEDRKTVDVELDTRRLVDTDFELSFPRHLVRSSRDEKLFFSKRSPAEARSDVKLHRTASVPTDDQAFWAAIRSSTNTISFGQYQKFINRLFCGSGGVDGDVQTMSDHLGMGNLRSRIDNARQLNIYGPYAYTVLKLATQAFLTLKSGVHLKPATFETYRPNLNDEAARFNQPDVTIDDLQAKLQNYLVGSNEALPYMDRIVQALLPDIRDRDERLPYCYDILQHRFTQPSLIELIWSYWLEEGMLAQTMNAIALRFQNQRSGPNDPLAELEIDPLRPLNNMIWGFVQDRYNQLSVSRRAAEYDHQYGLRLVGRAVPELQSADSRSKFIEAFHNLLYRTSIFYREDADTTVIADAFPLLNALKDVHLLLAEGAHNQYGDLPWTARTEMLSQQWMLARPEMREFLRGRHMVPYQEDWMGAVDAMKKLQGWTDTTISHFHELAVDGERVLLSIRFGNWSDLNLSEDNARNWARYWKPEIQRYLYGYQAVTGVDLMNEVTDTREAEVRYLQPSALLQRRLAGQSRQPAALAAAPRRPAIAAPAGQGYAALPRPQQNSRVSRMRAIKYEQGE
jgi:hypothetical protein